MAMMFTLKSQIDESVLSIISDVCVAVEICTTDKKMQYYNANKIQPNLKYRKHCGKIK